MFATVRDFQPRRDLIAILTLAAIAIPEQLATAQLAGMPAGQGLLVFMAAALVMTVVSKSPSLSVGADSTIAPVLVTAGVGAAVPGTMPIIAAMVGAILVGVAVFRLERIARLLSIPVATGMMAGISVHILVGRLPAALGLEPAPGSVVETLSAVWRDWPDARAGPFVLAVGVVAACLAGLALGRRFPAPLVALALASACVAVIDPAGVLFRRVAVHDLSLELHMPGVTLEAALGLLPTAMTVAVLCLFQTTMILREGQGDTPELRRNAFASVGLANIVSAGVGSFAVNSSPPRTKVVRDTGASGQLVGLGAAILGLLLVVIAPRTLTFLPVAALSGVLAYIALRIFPLAKFKSLLRHSPAEAVIALATMVFVILLPLQSGLPLAILVSLLHATLPLFATQVVELRQIPGTTIWWHQPETERSDLRKDVIVLGITSPVNFANAEGVVAEILGFLRNRATPPRVVVLEGAGMLSVDITGAECLARMFRDLRADDIEIGLARVESDRAREQLGRSGLLDELGENRIFNSVDDAIRALA